MGRLFGIQNKEGAIEISATFPLPSGLENKDSSSLLQETEKLLKELNYDHSSVGWFSTLPLEDFLQQNAADISLQSQVFPSVIILVDLEKSVIGLPFIKAYTCQQGRNMEVPVKISVSSIEKLFLLDSSGIEQKYFTTVTCNSDSVNLSIQSAGRNLVSRIEDLVLETGKNLHQMRSSHKNLQNFNVQLAKMKNENVNRIAAKEAPMSANILPRSTDFLKSSTIQFSSASEVKKNLEHVLSMSTV
ncbi:MAG: hypothetical protein K2X08_07330 [Chlamydiales bacterium]|nr:hypothetical protein [Chlamydiales bacterium]